MVKNSILLLVFFTFSLLSIKAQYRFISLKDKSGTAYSLSKPQEFLSDKAIKRRTSQGIALTEKDLPVSENYVKQVSDAGATVIYKSKWMNGLLIEANEEVYKTIKSFPFVNTEKDMTFKRKKSGNRRRINISGKKNYPSFRQDYGGSITQNQMLGIDAMHKEGYHGEGITIAVLDAGFYRTDQISLFDTIIKNNQVIATYDFINREEDVYNDDSHGMQVLSAVAGYKEGGLIGGAYKSNYVLLKTEDIPTESKLEEIYWTLGAEFADSIGCDILTTSLGYNYFDNPEDNYTIDDLDGNTAMITIAADYAAYTGMLVVVSVGNEGTDSWGTLTVPADGDSVLSVGAVNKQGEYVHFSSRGNTADNRIKPDVVALGLGTVVAHSSGEIGTNTGTSFAAPLVAGLAAGLWQAFPELKAIDLLEVIKKSGSNVYNADSLRGYGVPNYTTAKQLIINGIDNPEKNETIVFPNPLNKTSLIIKDTNFINGETVKVLIYGNNNNVLLNNKLVVKNQEISMNEQLISALIPGTYFIKITSKKSKTLKKLIKL